MNPLRIAPSLLSCDFARIADEVARVERSGGDWHHVDVMDGHFVPNLTIGPPVVRRIHAIARLPLDVHLMIEEPGRWASDYAAAGAHVLTFHVEACRTASEVRATIAAFRAAGVPQVGIALKPDGALERIRPYLDEVDLVLVMSVYPGFGGQEFHPQVLPRVRELRAAGWTGLVEMDGGLSAETVARCAAAGADVLVAGSALFGAPDMATAIDRFRAAAERARGVAAREGSPG
ncbi:MAG: ribulose-phosphate 3-epimerase [Planctomycetota bacterium]